MKKIAKHKIEPIVFSIINNSFLIGLCILCVFPILHIFSVSFAPMQQALTEVFLLWPERITLDAYFKIFSTPVIPRALLVSVIITVGGVFISMVLTTCLGYVLSIEKLPGHRLFNFLVFFTMIFGGGLIPLYQVVRSLGMINTLWALMVPNALNAFWVILMRNFISNIPEEITESAYLDGVSEMTIMIKIILPLSKPVIAAITLFYAVRNWNAFFQAIMFITNPKLWPIQVWLRTMISETGAAAMNVAEEGEKAQNVLPITMQMAVIVVATVPIMCVYPFLQKYFTKGIMLGSVKG